MQDIKTRAIQKAIDLYGSIPERGELSKPKCVTPAKTRKNLIFGVGLNDCDYMIAMTVHVENKSVTLWQCPAYIAWRNMIQRVYDPKHFTKNKTYYEVTVCEEWHRFTKFREWFVLQNWRGNQLDKDLLANGKKMYSPETCLFVPQEVNLFFIDSAAARGSTPIGVSWNNLTKKYKASISINGKRKYLGQFSCPDEAHSAWLKVKREAAIKMALNQSDERVASAILNHPIFAQLASGKN